MVNWKTISILDRLVIGYLIVHFLLKAILFLLLKIAEFSVETTCLFLRFGRDKGKTMWFSVEGDCPDCTTVIFINAVRFLNWQQKNDMMKLQA